MLQSVSGDYVLRVEVFYYSCEGSENCDNEFFVCVRPFNAAPLTDVRTATTIANVTARADILGCLQPPAAFRSNNDFDASGISNFTGQSFLGIPNPMEFPVTASQWEVSSVTVSYNYAASAACSSLDPPPNLCPTVEPSL